MSDPVPAFPHEWKEIPPPGPSFRRHWRCTHCNRQRYYVSTADEECVDRMKQIITELKEVRDDQENRITMLAHQLVEATDQVTKLTREVRDSHTEMEQMSIRIAELEDQC